MQWCTDNGINHGTNCRIQFSKIFLESMQENGQNLNDSSTKMIKLFWPSKVKTIWINIFVLIHVWIIILDTVEKFQLVVRVINILLMNSVDLILEKIMVSAKMWVMKFFKAATLQCNRWWNNWILGKGKCVPKSVRIAFQSAFPLGGTIAQSSEIIDRNFKILRFGMLVAQKLLHHQKWLHKKSCTKMLACKDSSFLFLIGWSDFLVWLRIMSHASDYKEWLMIMTH